jgi:hypothetical protein
LKQKFVWNSFRPDPPPAPPRPRGGPFSTKLTIAIVDKSTVKLHIFGQKNDRRPYIYPRNLSAFVEKNYVL